MPNTSPRTQTDTAADPASNSMTFIGFWVMYLSGTVFVIMVAFCFVADGELEEGQAGRYFSAMFTALLLCLCGAALRSFGRIQGQQLRELRRLNETLERRIGSGTQSH